MSLTPLDSAQPTNSSGEPTHTLTRAKQTHSLDRFTPAHDMPCEHVQPNTVGRVSDELLDMLAEDHRINLKHHLVVDKLFKAYLLEKKNFANVMRT
ncbi:conserved hypothetical protein [Leishmania major strain Friedlin]|uniref:Uncharacterized protein n=1 Tax=Leishmania major TaxID=5664 RepID=Q4QF37_LEIMA|nr:conserved hypothetical protein [Leishmania major strain Friedlin]CAG9571599.1 hypothetical_protein_-_conserved [Leishmania major strain Friedlin]CAJ03373.1 conserved hypothetical protein [Leishmania major strain Friedlin]|eukprot:XP_001682061.1 conserved hypothetical protein [Leishmania major strain Friedlin]